MTKRVGPRDWTVTIDVARAADLVTKRLRVTVQCPHRFDPFAGETKSDIISPSAPRKTTPRETKSDILSPSAPRETKSDILSPSAPRETAPRETKSDILSPSATGETKSDMISPSARLVKIATCDVDDLPRELGREH